ncbi:energy transducer TonB [Spirosoma foliorum]|uniref:Energy transducer TonB n=1 Tax=Spirosoma foliorum TaxID=2710596 RepID=A0A7G5GPX1_9BACT|nr:energy transducer TonB [Spirosoma foliorum]QMW00913.1 energy transducer TonB [Spirosoma foliorum]
MIFSTVYSLILSRTYALSVGLLVLSVASFAQTTQQRDVNVYTIVETQPEFPGGINALINYLKVTINYPAEAQEAKIKGRVFVSFVVEIDGSLTDIIVLKGLGYGCDEEAMRVVKAMPCWIPGSQSGRLIRVKYNLPIAFGTDFPKRKGH